MPTNMLITNNVEILINGSNVIHFERLGYTIPRKYNEKKEKNELILGTKITVNPFDLTDNCASVEVQVKCDYCGKVHNKVWRKFLKGRTFIEKDACEDCARKKQTDIYVKRYGIKNWCQSEEGRKRIGDMKRKYTIDDINQLFERECYKLISTTFQNSSQPLYYICEKHKNQGVKHISLNHFLSGGRCKSCVHKRIGENQKVSNEELNMLIESNNNEWLNYGEYVNYKTHNLQIKCSQCNDSFTTSLSVYVASDKHRCKKCTDRQSKYEFIVEDILSRNNVYFDTEVRFDDCRFNKSMPFDFVIYDKSYNVINCIIEVDGEHHFRPICFGGMKEILAQEQFKKQQQRDEMKNRYCEKNNIKLIRIPYWEINNIESILLNNNIIR